MKLNQMSNLEREAFLLEQLYDLPVFLSWSAKERAPEVYPFAVYDRRAIKDACEYVRVFHPHQILGGGAPWSPTRDIAQAYEVEEKLTERGGLSDYVGALRRVTQAIFTASPSDGDLWMLLHATAGERVEAACLVLMEGKAR